MKSHSRQIRLIVLIGIIASALGCATDGINARIAEKSAVFEKLNPETQKNLREGTIEPGYTADMVYIALGKPSKEKIRDTSQGKVGIWEYANFYPEGYEAAPTSAGSTAADRPVSIASAPGDRHSVGAAPSKETTGTDSIQRAPTAGAVANDTEEPVIATTSFDRPGSADYGHVKTKPESDPSYVALDRRGSNPGLPREGSFTGRSGAMDLLDVPEMDSASLYVVFYEGRVVQMKLRRN
jgi:hypothetical protein